MRATSFLKWPQALLCILIALASWRFLPLGVAASMEHMLYHALERPLTFYAHITLAPLALFLMPFQFWNGLRVRRPAVHRVIGRIYVLSILGAGLSSIHVAMGTQAGILAAWGFGLLGVAWVLVTLKAVHLAMQRKIAQHRRWMIRSAALTFAAVTLRIYTPLVFAFGLPFEPFYVLISWACWVPNLLVVEYFLRRNPPRRATPA